MKKTLRIFFVILCFSLAAFAQSETDERLARQFYQQQEYEKASDLFEKLYNKNPGAYYNEYYDCLLKLKDYKTAEKIIKKQIKKEPARLYLYVDLGNIYESAGDNDKAVKEYEKAISNLSADPDQVIMLGTSFMNSNKTDLAIKTYLQGRKILKDIYPFNFELAEVYQKKGDYASMVSEYLSALDSGDGYLQQVQSSLQDFIALDTDNKKTEVLRTQLLKKVQANPDRIAYAEMLIWLYMQQKDFEAAFFQTKALDKRFRQDGSRIMSLAQVAAANRNYDVAVKCYQYIVAKGTESYLYSTARMELLNVMNKKILESAYTQTDIQELEKLYQSTLNDLGRSASTAAVIKGLAHLEAFYLGKADVAIKRLEELLQLPQVTQKMVAEIKLELGDIYLFSGERWEATLLYSQVEKAFHEDLLGQEAKFRNAKLSYYTGDFEWAQGQLTVLKASTSKLIANDALDLSLLITDNTGLDSNLVPMMIYARADLLHYQNQDSLAMLTLDSISKEYPSHPLADNILYKKAQIQRKRGNYNAAIELYNEILEDHGFDILGDDALFSLAELTETYLKDKEKAKQLYQDILTKYPGSLYTVEARKRFRTLRGDNLN